MKVIANKKGFDGVVRLEGEEFDFEYKLNEDGTDNIGSWFDLTEEAEKEVNKQKRALEKKLNKNQTQNQES